MSIKITYFLDVTSSWCYWAEPAWSALRQRYAGDAEFAWKIALLPLSAMAVSEAQCEWFYQRSGTIVRSPFKLHTGWFEADAGEYLAPNLVTEAARDFGIEDDRVRLALAHAALREGRQILRWDEAADVAAAAAGLDARSLLERARSPEVGARARASSAEFHALQVIQRPTFVLQNGIGDRAVFSGLARVGPIAATLDAMIEDEAAYASFAAQFGGPPTA